MDDTTHSNLLERAIAIAVEAHVGQRDKADQPYIMHPLRVMLACSRGPAQIVAVLHDVVEDTPWTMERLRQEGFGDDILVPLELVTKRRDGEEDYAAFIERASRHPVAREVKMADLRDNLDLSRIASPTERDHERIRKYEDAVALLRTAEHDRSNSGTKFGAAGQHDVSLSEEAQR